MSTVEEIPKTTNENPLETPSKLPQPNQDEPPKELFDDPDADLILCSRDSQEFRILGIYIIKSSPVLAGMIKATSYPSDTADSVASAEEMRPSLPVVQLPDSGVILSSLLTFTFPVTPVLPPTLEMRMELLSVAQKYSMNSVLGHIRGIIALQDPPFICPENVFHAYYLAQKYGLRQEISQAARITLKFSFTIENLEGKLDATPGAYLYELWDYHKNVQKNLSTTFSHYRKFNFAMEGRLQSLFCFNCSSSGIPKWLDDYIDSIAREPSLFDIIELQMALVRHGGGCASCSRMSVPMIQTFWTALTAVVHRDMQKAESTLRIVGERTDYQDKGHVNSVGSVLPLPKCLDLSGADIIVQSSDNVNFRIHKSILASSSEFFRDMFSLPQPSNDETLDGLPVLHLSEDAGLVRALITLLYPIPSEIPSSYDRLLALLAAAGKYDMFAIQSSIRGEVKYMKLATPTGVAAFRAYAIASSNRLFPEANDAAHLTLDHPMTFEYLEDGLRLFEGQTLSELVNFRKLCRDSLVSCLEAFLDIHSGPSKIWVGCPGQKQNPTKLPARKNAYGTTSALEVPPPTLPSWLHNLFKQNIEQLKQTVYQPLVNESDISGEYLAALYKHTTQDDCIFCLKVHAQMGESYLVELEKRVAQARDSLEVSRY